MGSIYVPTTLLNLIGFASFYYKWFDFQNRIMVTLTSLLVMTTLFAQLTATLPKTSYIKMLDIWFLFSMVFCFFIIFIHTMVEFSHKYGLPDEEKRNNEVSELLSPKVGPVEDEEKNQKKNSKYQRSKNINKYGFYISTITYITFVALFWIYTLIEQARQHQWHTPPVEKLPSGYPD